MSMRLASFFLYGAVGLSSQIAWSVPPATPTGLTAKGGTGVAGLNWADVIDASSYRVYRAEAGVETYTLMGSTNRSRWFDPNATGGKTWHYRVTALNATAEESSPAEAQITADTLTINRPADRGSYRIGSSFVVDDYRLKQAYTARGYNVPTYRRQIIGAGIEYIWSDTVTNRPAEHEGHVSILQQPDYDVLVLNAQTLWTQANRENSGILLWSEEALAANPDYRIFLHEYWTREAGDSNTWWDETNSQPREMLRLHQLTAWRSALYASNTLGVPVYVCPFGSAIEAVKEAAAAGEFTAFNSRDDLHPDGSHLSDFGKYIQELVVFSGAYQQDPRGLPAQITPGVNLSASDASLAQQLIYEAVRQTPFSGWHEGAASTLAGHLSALEQSLHGWQDFTSLTTGGAAGTLTDYEGNIWTYTKLFKTGSGYDVAGELDPGGKLSVTLPAGLLSVRMRMRPTGSGTGEISVRINGTVKGVWKNIATEYWGRRLTGLEYGGSVTMELENTGAVRVRMDDIIWEDAGAGSGAVNILTYELDAAVIGTNYTRQLSAYGGSGGYNWSLVESGLPNGMSLSASGLISGTPIATGITDFTVKAADVADPAVFQVRNLRLVVANPTQIISSPATAAYDFGVPVTWTVQATGDELRYRWYINGIAVPDSNSATYYVPSFGPLQVGDWQVEVTGTGGRILSPKFTVSITGGSNVQLLTTTLSGQNTNLSGNTFDLTNTGPDPIRLTGRLAGNFNAKSGLVISGYWRAGTAKGFESNASGWNAWGTTTTFTGNGYGNATLYDLGAPLDIAPGQTIGVYLLLTQNQSNLAYSASTQVYQQGPLRLSPGIGLGLGQPFVGQIFNSTRLYNGSVEFVVDASPVLSSATLPSGRIGAAYEYDLGATSGNAPLAYSIAGGLLPPGLSLDAASGRIQGRPTLANDFDFLVRVTDADGDTSTANLRIVVSDPWLLWLSSHGLPPQSSYDEDPNGEHLALLLRHALGLPTSASAMELLPGIGGAGAAPGSYVFHFSRNYAATGTQINVWASQDLITWKSVFHHDPTGETVTGATVIDRTTQADADVDIIRLEVTADPPASPIYIRVSATPWPY
ncbi:MAG: Ig domain-containing protein [Verrucomicrobiota bacterium]|nr:Ig domain-containing protein [Verrucomicrobiota bacterium]